MLNAAIELSEKLIAVESLTPTHPDTPPEKAENGLVALKELMDFAQHAVLQQVHVFEGNDANYPQRVHTLHTVWESNVFTTSRVRLLYIGHVDVVPANPKEWKSHPFNPTWRDDKLYGRGAVDMKTPVACAYAAIEHFCAHSSLPFEIHAVITTDEEYAALNGVDPVLRTLKKQGLNFDAVLVGEPSNFDIAIGRRGSYNIKAVVKGLKGHMAYDESYRNALKRARQIADALEAIPFETHPDWKAQTKLIIRRIDSDSDSTSVVPGKAEVYFNIRFTGNYTPQQLLKMVEKAIRPYRGKGMKISLQPSQYPQVAYNGMPQGASDVFVTCLANAIRRHTGEWPQQTHSGGTSDGRYVQQYWPGIPVVEFGPLVHTMHQPNEHISMPHIRLLCTILHTLFETYFQAYNRPGKDG
ncbi:MAG: succinyl-diaminopimelate desuccinylase [Blastochloris viridis]|uniref:Succinyl-diaminopimelate desuccinylase n=1 Tax=Blastochloris viridis TaxID=1079 RepID=A0A6N4R572_BLAVI|nr:MAG: succinyl-diaminopimelate desuccinylase [Blastochloris viridis]